MLLQFSMTLQTEILTSGTSDVLTQINFLKSFNSVVLKPVKSHRLQSRGYDMDLSEFLC